MAGLLLAVMTSSAGCGALLLVGGAGTSAIAFATGELRAVEEAPLQEVDVACEIAIETLGYEDVVRQREPEKIRWQATTPGGDPVDIRLIAKGPDRTTVRIRVGVFGDEGRSRLVLEQIRQSL
jgi:hypothetical protein